MAHARSKRHHADIPTSSAFFRADAKPVISAALALRALLHVKNQASSSRRVTGLQPHVLSIPRPLRKQIAPLTTAPLAMLPINALLARAAFI